VRVRPRAVGGVVVALSLAAAAEAAAFVSSQPDTLPADYPASLERERQRLRDAAGHTGSERQRLLRLADVHLNMGDDLHRDADRRRAAYEEGARLAARALELHEPSADAHFLYAANLGSAARLRGVAAGSVGVIRDVRRHLERAIALDPRHAPALQLMGGLLAELPWYLGGDAARARGYLDRAVAVDGNFTNARLLLAKLLIRQGQPELARHQLLAVIHATRPHFPYTWARWFRPEAERLLATLPTPSRGDTP
jgi:tetratricopeptide (TPR) repeat protein